MRDSLRRLLSRFRGELLKRLLEEWAWIGGYMRRYTGQILYYILLGVFGTLFGLAGSLLSKRLIDAVTGFDSGAIGLIVGLYVAFELAGMGLSALNSRISTKIQTRVFQEIRADVFDRILLTDWEILAEYHSGDLLNRAGGDTNTVASSVLGFLPGLVTNGVQFFGALAIILYYDPVMALITLSGAPILALSSRWLLRRMREFQLESRRISSEIMAFHNEAFQNIQFIKAFELACRFMGRLKELQAKSYEFTLRHNLFSIATTSALGLIGKLISWLIFGWSVYRLWQGNITFGTMTLFLQMSGTLSGAFNALVGSVPAMVSAGTAARRVMDIVELKREDRSREKEAAVLLKAAREQGCAIRLEGAAFSYRRGRQVFSGVNLEAGPGEIVALVGPTGAGKTTLLRLLLGLVELGEGLAEARPARDAALALPLGPATRRLFTYVPQGNMLFSGTIAENLRMVKPGASREEMASALEDACVLKEVLALPQGLDAPIGEWGHGFSEGQAQRISIARALLSDAPVFLLDEATSALDIATERRVLRGILKAAGHRTVIVATHRPSVLDLCTRVYRVAEGRVWQMGEEERRRMAEDF